jgi:adenylate cyclase
MGTSRPAQPIQLSRPFMLWDWVVAPARGEFRRNGITERVEPKAMEVLVFLAQHPGEVVTRDDLERHVWRGALVGYDAVTNTVLKLRKALGDDAREPSIIATIPKRGYRLVAPVRYLDEPAVPSTTAETPPSTEDSSDRSETGEGSPAGCAYAQTGRAAGKSASRPVPLPAWRRLWPALVGTLMAIVAVGAAFYWSRSLETLEPASGLGGKLAAPPSVLVLPFASIGDDPLQERFADGITEDLITDLSRLAQLAVIASNTSFSYQGRRVTPQEAGRELGVDFIVEGSIRRDGESVRLNARLVDAKTGLELWAMRYDRPLAQVFAVQDALTGSIVNALAVRLTPHERESLAQRPTDSLVAYDRFQEGQRLAKDQTAESARRAEAAYRSAIEADPDYGRAYGAWAYVFARSFRFGWTDTPLETIDRALELAKKAVARDAAIPQTHWALGYVYLMRRDYAKAEAAARAALQVAPNYADGYGLLAFIKNALGQPAPAIALIQRGMQLNPYYTWDYPYNLGRAYYALGRTDDAIRALEEARRRNENAPGTRLYLAAAYVRAGRQADAEREVQELAVLSPSETIAHLKKADPIDDPKLMEAFVADLRKAGLPE